MLVVFGQKPEHYAKDFTGIYWLNFGKSTANLIGIKKLLPLLKCKFNAPPKK